MINNKLILISFNIAKQDANIKININIEGNVYKKNDVSLGQMGVDKELLRRNLGSLDCVALCNCRKKKINAFYEALGRKDKLIIYRNILDLQIKSL